MGTDPSEQRLTSSSTERKGAQAPLTAIRENAEAEPGTVESQPLQGGSQIQTAV